MPLSGTRNIILEVQYVSLLKIILFGIVIKIVSCFLYLEILNSVGGLEVCDEIVTVVPAPQVLLTLAAALRMLCGNVAVELLPLTCFVVYPAWVHLL